MKPWDYYKWWNEHYPQSTDHERLVMWYECATRAIFAFPAHKETWIQFFKKYGPSEYIEIIKKAPEN